MYLAKLCYLYSLKFQDVNILRFCQSFQLLLVLWDKFSQLHSELQNP